MTDVKAPTQAAREARNGCGLLLTSQWPVPSYKAWLFTTIVHQLLEPQQVDAAALRGLSCASLVDPGDRVPRPVEGSVVGVRVQRRPGVVRCAATPAVDRRAAAPRVIINFVDARTVVIGPQWRGTVIVVTLA